MKKYFLFLVFSLLTYLTHVYYSGHGIYGDGNAYWAHAHAIFFQGNLDYTQIFDHLQHYPGKSGVFDRTFWSMQPTITDKLPNPWFIGTSILWLPFLLATKLIFQILKLSPNPYHLIWETIPGIAGIFLSLIGLRLSELTLNKFFPTQVSRLTTLVLFLSTNLLFYTAFEPALSHSAIFFLHSLIVYLFLSRHTSPTHFLILGLLTGMSTITRPSGITIGVLIVYKIFHNKFHYQERVKYILASALGFSIGILPQLIVQNYLFGSPVSISYLSGYHGQAEFNLSYLPQALFSPQRGLLIWTPVLMFAYFGLIQGLIVRALARTNVRKTHTKFIPSDNQGSVRVQNPSKDKVKNSLTNLPIPFLSYLLLHFLFVGTWNGILSAGFSNRFFIETYPVLIFGLACVFSIPKPRWRHTIFLLSLYWNFALLLQFFTDKPRLIDQQGITFLNLIWGQFSTPFQVVTSLIRNLD